MQRSWTKNDNFDIVSEESSMWSNKWKHNIDVTAEDLIVLDLVRIVAQNMMHGNEGALKIHLYCKVVWEILTTNRLKSSQCEMDGGFIEIKREFKAKFEHTHMKIQRK